MSEEAEEHVLVKSGMLNRKVGGTEDHPIFEEEMYHLFLDGTLRTTHEPADNRPYWRTEAAWRVGIPPAVLRNSGLRPAWRHAFEIQAIPVTPALTHAHTQASTSLNSNGHSSIENGQEQQQEPAAEEKVDMLFVCDSVAQAKDWVGFVHDLGAIRVNLDVDMDGEEDMEWEEAMQEIYESQELKDSE